MFLTTSCTRLARSRSARDGRIASTAQCSRRLRLSPSRVMRRESLIFTDFFGTGPVSQRLRKRGILRSLGLKTSARRRDKQNGRGQRAGESGARGGVVSTMRLGTQQTTSPDPPSPPLLRGGAVARPFVRR